MTEDTTNRADPHNPDAEIAVLAACIIDESRENIAAVAARGLTPDSFYDWKHQILFLGILAYNQTGQPINEVALADFLQSKKLIDLDQPRFRRAENRYLGALDAIGGVSFIEQVNSRIETTALVLHYCDIILECAARRQIIAAANRALLQASDGAPPAEIMANWQKAAESVRDPSSNGHGLSIHTIDEILAHITNPADKIWGDGYLTRREILYFPGPAGVGKSSFLMKMACNQIAGLELCGIPFHCPPLNWLFIGQENSIERYQADLLKLLPHYSPENQLLIKKHLLLHTPDRDHDRFLDATDPESFNRLKTVEKKFHPDVAALDPYSDFVKDGLENDSAANKETISALRKAFPNSALILLQHAGGGENRLLGAVSRYTASSFARGSQVPHNACRCQINLLPGDAEDSSRIILSCSKCNNGRAFTTMGLVFNPDSFQFDPDPDFDLEDWIKDYTGKRSGSRKACHEPDVCRAVSSGHTTRAEILDFLIEETGASRATIDRMLVKCKNTLIESPMRGIFNLTPAGIKLDQKNK